MVKKFKYFLEESKKIVVKPNYNENGKRNGWQVVELGDYSDYVFDVWPTKAQATKAAREIKQEIKNNKK